MEFFDSSKSILENIYFLSGPIIALFAVAGVFQLFLTKKAIKINSQRESANIAAQQVREYSTNIIPLINKYNFALRKEKIKPVDIELGPFRRSYLEKKLGKERVREIQIERLRTTIFLLEMLNSLEAFATYFTKGVADEEIAYPSIGKTFCFTIESHFFDIGCCRKEEDYSYQNIIELYEIWKGRMKKEKLTKQQKEILKELMNIKSDTVKPIGTN